MLCTFFPLLWELFLYYDIEHSFILTCFPCFPLHQTVTAQASPQCKSLTPGGAILMATKAALGHTLCLTCLLGEHPEGELLAPWGYGLLILTAFPSVEVYPLPLCREFSHNPTNMVCEHTLEFLQSNGKK